MRIHGRNTILAAVGAVVMLAAGAGSAVAAAPKGETLATGLPEGMRLDAERQQIVHATPPSGVRTIDLRSGATRDFDVAATCPAPPGGTGLWAVGDGYALLTCMFPVGEGGSVYSLPSPRVLDLSSGETIVPAGLREVSALPNPHFHRISGTTIFFTSTDHRQSGVMRVLDWRTGAIALDPNRPLVCPPGRVRWIAGAAGWDDAVGCDGRGRVALSPPLRAGEQALAGGGAGELLSWGLGGSAGARQYAYAHACRTRLAWDVPRGTTSWVAADDDLLLKETDGGLVTLRRVPLDGICDRTARPWTLRVSSSGRTTRVQPATAQVSDAVTGAAATLMQPLAARPATLRAAQGGRVAVAADATAVSLRWRTDGRSWRRATDQGRRWMLGLPRGARTLQLDLRLRDGSRGSYAVKLRRAGR